MHTPTDYFRGTTLEPEATSSLKASFEEYEALGQRHRDVSSRIEKLNEAMKLSRQRGAFQQLQAQMKEVKELVKQREDLDGKMAVADLARKKDDDHRLAVKQEVSYAEGLNSVGNRINQLVEMVSNFAEFSEGEFDFARCQRPDGSFYGTRGKCKKGKDAGVSGLPQASTDKNKGAKKSSKEHRELLNEILAVHNKALINESSAKKARKTVEKQTKGDNSPEARKRRGEAQKAHEKAQAMVEKTGKVADKTYSAFVRARKREEMTKMSPQQRAAERALDREMKLRG